MVVQLKRQERIIALGIKEAKVFGELIHLLKVNGTPVPIMDALIGSIGISKGFIVIITDHTHFETIKSVQDKLRVQFW